LWIVIIEEKIHVWLRSHIVSDLMRESIFGMISSITGLVQESVFGSVNGFCLEFANLSSATGVRFRNLELSLSLFEGLFGGLFEGLLEVCLYEFVCKFVSDVCLEVCLEVGLEVCS